MTIPRHRIPKIKAECIACGGTSTSTVMSQAFAAGYHRRHICNQCDAPFYTLAHYGKNTYDIQAKPFKDRALTPWEAQQRLEWEAEGAMATLEVTSPFATEFIEHINKVFVKHEKGAELTYQERRLIDTINQIESDWTT